MVNKNLVFSYKNKNRYAYATILSSLVKAGDDSKYGEVNMREFKISSGLDFSELPMKIGSMIEVRYIKCNLIKKIRYIQISDLGHKYLNDNHAFIILANDLNKILDPPISNKNSSLIS